MVKEEKDGLTFFRFQNLSKFPEIANFVSTRLGGVSKPPYDSLNIGFKEDHVEPVIENSKRLASVIGIPLGNFVFCNQVHGDNVVSVGIKDKGKGVYDRESAIQNCDAMITHEYGICLSVLSADCVPILLYDPQNKVIAAVHSGWRGAVKKILTRTLQRMVKEYGSNSEDIFAGIGPSIGPDSYEVRQDVIQPIKQEFPGVELIKMQDSEKGLLDLWTAQVVQLIQLGVLQENIEVSGIDTYTNTDLFYSYRRTGATGLFATGIMMRD